MKAETAEEFFLRKSPEEMKGFMEEEIFDSRHMIGFAEDYATQVTAAKDLDLRLMETDRDQQKRLRESCEKALEERDAEIKRLRETVAELLKLLDDVNEISNPNKP